MKRLRALIAVFLALPVMLAFGQIARADVLTPPSGGKLAVTPEQYDDMGAVLQKLGYTADVINEEDLKSAAKLSTYDAIYINCSSSIDGVIDEAAAVVAEYVRNGGVVYASDFAQSLISKAFPGKINFYNGSDGAKAGVTGVVQAKIVDAGLASVIGKAQVEINFDLPNWVVIDSAGTGTQVHMTAPVGVFDSSDYSQSNKSLPDKPLVVTFREGKGSVLYTSFHNEAQTSTDVGKILNWFAIWAKSGKTTQAARTEAEQGGNKVLQEIIDSINPSEAKTYAITSTGDSEVAFVLNFGGSALSFKVTDASGKKVINEKVSEPPFTKKVQLTKGIYNIEIGGVDVPQENYPFTLAMGGKEGAIEGAYTSTEVTKIKPSILKNPWLWVGVGLFLGVVFIVVMVIVLVLKLSKKNAAGSSDSQK